MSDITQQVRLHILSEGAQVIDVEPGSTVAMCMEQSSIHATKWPTYTFTMNNEDANLQSVLPNADTPILLVASPNITGGF